MRFGTTRSFGLVAPGYSMAKVALRISFIGRNELTLRLLVPTWVPSSNCWGLMLVSVKYTAKPEGAQSYVPITMKSNSFTNAWSYRLMARRLSVRYCGWCRGLRFATANQTKWYASFPENPSVLILPNVVDDSGSAMGVEALPDSAVICSCFDVTKGDIKDAVSAGCTHYGGTERNQQTLRLVVAVVLLLLNRFW